MFGRRKNLLMDQMEALVIAAQIITCTAIGEAAGAYDSANEEAKDGLIAVAAAKANYLFARDTNDSHKLKFNIRELEREADTWLSHQTKLQELVVQSLRVLNMVAFGRTGQAAIPPLGGDILEKYGKHYPDAPDLDAYPALVRQALDGLNQRNRDGLLQGFERRGIYI